MRVTRGLQAPFNAARECLSVAFDEITRVRLDDEHEFRFADIVRIVMILA